MKTQQFKRYIPTLISDELNLLTYPRKDNLYVILDLIFRKEIYYKSDQQNSYGFTEIPKAQFKELLPSSDNLQEDIEFLIDKGFIRRNDFYTIGQKCKSYKISTEYLGKTVPVLIQNKNINKRIALQIKKYRKIKVKSLEFAKTEYFKTFKIDIVGALKAILENSINEIKLLGSKFNLELNRKEIEDIIYCKEDSKRNRLYLGIRDEGRELNNILHRYMIYLTRINSINDGFLFFKRNPTNGRLDSNLTSLPSFLRPYIISTERLMNVDIKNSQPYFLYTLIKNKPEINPAELKLYASLVLDGTLYEFLGNKFKAATGYERTRKQIKQILFKIFYSRNSSFKSYKDFFSSIFPSIMEYINTTNADQHNTLSIQLQTIESFSVLDIVMPMLELNGIRPYTIHDSFVCKESEAKTIEETFNAKLIELHGVAPALHLDYIDVIEQENDDDEDIVDFDESLDELWF